MKRLVFILLIAMGLWWVATLSSPSFETSPLESRVTELPTRPDSALPEETLDFASLAPDETDPAPIPAPTLLEATDPRGFPRSRVTNRRQAKKEKASSLSPYRSGLRIESGDASYGVLTLRALPVEHYRESMGPSVYERQGFIYYQPLQPSSDPFSLKDGFPVFEKGSSGLLGFWTGVFHIRMTPRARPETLASKYGLSLASFDSGLRWAALHSKETPDPQGLLSRLRTEPTVTDADLEIVFSLKETR